MFWVRAFMILFSIADGIHRHLNKYWIALQVCFLVFNLPNYLSHAIWFLLGAITAIILSGFSKHESSDSPAPREKTTITGILSTASIINDLNHSFRKSEGWMLTYPLESQTYSEASHNVKSIKVVLIRIDSHHLRISFPNSRHSIPKKRVGDGKEINFDTQDDKNFARHTEYDLRQAKIEIVPVGLCRKRIWSKKHPISISLAMPYLNNFVGNKFESSTLNEKGRKLYLFARTDREKDDWYRRLIYASKGIATDTQTFNLPSKANRDPEMPPFVSFMREICPNLLYRSSNEFPPTQKRSTVPTILNAFLGGFFYDLIESSSWINEIRSRVERKILSIRKLAIVESIRLKELDLGTSIPKLISVSEPWLDSKGIWGNVEMEYSGKITISIEIILTSLSPKISEVDNPSKHPDSHPMFDSEVEDSGDESGIESMDQVDSFAKTSMGKWLIESIAPTPIILTVEIQRISGILAVNFPPAPSDRVWIGFSSHPNVEMEIKPKYGDWALNCGFLTEFIKRKLLLKFQRAIVCPNMIDLIVQMKEFKKSNK